MLHMGTILGHAWGSIGRNMGQRNGNPAQGPFVAQYKRMLLQNTEAFLCAARPDLMDASSRTSQRRLNRAARRTARFVRTSNET